MPIEEVGMMSNGAMLSAIGLLMDIVGAVLIFFFGIAPKYSKEVGLALNLKDDNPIKVDNNKGYARNKALSNTGILLLLAGFILQLFGNDWVRSLYCS
ncbi:MAG: hypothetical protein ACMZ66_05430 [Thalassospira sp.]|uniref:hypothetical protein n=1 Tax=Thalassospira sp. TaxID=1912094 RepID=UPI003A8886C2